MTTALPARLALRGRGRNEEPHLPPLPMRKAVEAVYVSPIQEPLSFLGRKIFNAMIRTAQETGKKQEFYMMPVSELAKLSGFASNDTAKLMNQALNLMKRMVRWNAIAEDGRSCDMGASWMVSEVRIARGMMSFAFSPSVRDTILDPKTFVPMDMRIQMRFTAGHGLALYEMLLRYVKNPCNLSRAFKVEELRNMLTYEAATYQEFKYFKRDVLMPSIREINKVSDIQVSIYKTKRIRRTVTHIQFEVTRRNPSALKPCTSLTDVGRALVKQLVGEGVRREEAEEWVIEFGEARIAAALQTLESRAKNPRLTALGSRLAYLRTVVLNGASAQASLPLPAPAAGAPATEVFAPSAPDPAIEAAQAHFYTLHFEHQRELLSGFKASLAPTHPYRSLAEKQGLDSAVVRHSFFAWLVKWLASAGVLEPKHGEAVEVKATKRVSTLIAATA